MKKANERGPKWMRRKLVLCNVLIIAVSAVLIFGLVSYANWSTHEIVRSFETKFDEHLHLENITPEQNTPTEPSQNKPFDLREPRATAEQLSSSLNLIITASVTVIIGLDLLLSNWFYRRLVRAAAEDEARRAATYANAKREMLNGISHDLRTPLTAVKGHLKGLQDGVAKTASKRAEYLDIAYQRTLDIENLLDRLFTTFDYETGELKLNLEPCDLRHFLRQTVSQNEYVRSGQLPAQFDFPRAKMMAQIDEVQFRRVLDNLITNTVKHNRAAAAATETGQTRAALSIKLTLRQAGSKIIMTYADNGKGVRPESLPRLFDEFFKEDASRHQDQSGSGLGLFVVRQIVESHGGKIAAAADGGLQFTITLPEAKHA